MPTATVLPAKGAKLVHLIRHGQAWHNEHFLKEGESAYFDWKNEDSRLNKVGQEQALDLRKEMRGHHLELVFVSTLTRCLQTLDFGLADHVRGCAGAGAAAAAAGGAGATGGTAAAGDSAVDSAALPGVGLALSRDTRDGREDAAQAAAAAARPRASAVPVVAMEEIRETHGAHPCNKRRPRSQLEVEYPYVDFGGVEHEEDVHYTDERESRAALDKRAAGFLATLLARPERSIAVVSHNDFLTALVQLPALRAGVEAAGMSVEPFSNCEVRSLVLATDTAGAADGDDRVVA